MGSDSFDARLEEIDDRIGHGRVRGSVVVDQVYAQYQHEGLDLRHPRGGEAKYLEGPLFANAAVYVETIATRVLLEGPDRAMADSMEDLSGEVFDRAPVEFMDLRSSGHPTVTRGGVTTVYDRPPMVDRLTPAQLRAKNHLRSLRDSSWAGADDY